MKPKKLAKLMRSCTRHYLKCTECGRVEAIEVVPFSIVKPSRKPICGCEEYSLTHISEKDAIDALARQHVEAAA
ncbi:hypothetical protein [Pararhizobium qamdonense]|uniref:hypothetical protein n=1 Tax=Pararhizobium qamdonense TaxID=3031126 RepID=UPI0023E1928E|nr:hypothetical protein [Pararhizobium qamdonense]